jgi:HYR domain
MRKPFIQTHFLTLALAFLSLPIFGQNGTCDYDNTPPQFTYCPSNIVVQSFNGGAIVAWRTPLATDNCTTPTVYNSSYRESGSFFYAGESEVSYTAAELYRASTAV